MNIVRGPRMADNFTILSNSLIRDNRLSLRARGLLVLLLSNADGWSTSSTQLAKELPEGRDAIRTALRELETVGYIRRRSFRNQHGQYCTETVVFEQPAEVTGTDSQAPSTGTDSQAWTGNPAPENQAPKEVPREELTTGGGARVREADPPADLFAETADDETLSAEEQEEIDLAYAGQTLWDWVGLQPSGSDYVQIRRVLMQVPPDDRPRVVREVTERPPPKHVESPGRFMLARLRQTIDRPLGVV